MQNAILRLCLQKISKLLFIISLAAFTSVATAEYHVVYALPTCTSCCYKKPSCVKKKHYKKYHKVKKHHYTSRCHRAYVAPKRPSTCHMRVYYPKTYPCVRSSCEATYYAPPSQKIYYADPGDFSYSYMPGRDFYYDRYDTRTADDVGYIGDY